MFSANQLIAHAVGDYVFQSDWMASTKTKSSFPALCHVVTYTLPFLLLTTEWPALLFIAGTHFAIDRWRLARYVIWAKNFLSPPTTSGEPVANDAGAYASITTAPPVRWHFPWSECSVTGYHKKKPLWLTLWLMIITDNLLHVLCNGLALYLWGSSG